MKTLAWTWIAVLAVAVPLRAHAESRPTLLDDHRPGSKRVALELGLGWYTDSQSVGSTSLPGSTTAFPGSSTTVHVLAPTFGVRLALSNSAELTLDWPLAFASVSTSGAPGESSFRTGNPLAAAYYMQQREDGYFRVGGGIALPLARIPSSGNLGAPFIAYGGVAAMNGLWSLWLYAVDRLTLVLPAQLETRSGPLVLGGDFGMGVMVPTDSNNKTDVVLQIAGSLGARISAVTVGGRLQAVWLATQQGDNAQLALVPFVQGDFSGGGFVYARLLVNLDEPLGVFGSGNGLLSKVWGLYLGGGTRF
jgi:hypothetical protein